MVEPSPSRWEILARERNARVVLCNNVETFGMMDLALGIDNPCFGRHILWSDQPH